MKPPSETPLTDIGDVYSESLDNAVKTGNIDDPKLAEVFVGPRELNITHNEREDIKRYVHERLAEIIERTETPVDQSIIASYIFRSIICGMMLAMQKW